MSVPVAIPQHSGQRGLPHPSDVANASPVSRSVSFSASPPCVGGVYGSSPPSRSNSSSDKNSSYLAAKKFWKRLRYDPSLDPASFSVGFIESRQQAERKSGAEAWSLRQQDVLTELPYGQLAARWPQGDIPFHRIAYFKQAGVVIWESDSHRGRQHEGDSSSSHPSTPYGVSPTSSSFMKLVGAGLPPVAPPPHLTSHPLTSGSVSSGGEAATPGRLLLPRQTSVLEGGAQPAAAAAAASSGGGGGTAAASSSSSGVRAAAGQSAADVVGAALEAAAAGTTAAAAPQQQAREVEAPPCPDYSALPEACWQQVLGLLCVRDLCAVSRVCCVLRTLAASKPLWEAAHQRLFGAPAPEGWSGPTIRRSCRRSELRAARWLDAAVECCPGGGGFSSACLQLDDSKVVAGEDCRLRLWSHETGRRIATLSGHTGRVLSVAFDEELIISGCSQSLVKLWSMDDLKALRSLRHHTGAVTSVLLHNGVPLSGGEDATVAVWDGSGASGAPVVVLDVAGAVHAMATAPSSGHLCVAGSSLELWDLASTSRMALLGGNTPADLAAAAAEDEEDEELALLTGMMGGPGGPGGAGAAQGLAPWTCVTAAGDLVAAGRAGEVLLWDLRTQQVVATWTAPPPTTTSSIPAAAVVVPPPPRPLSCPRGSGSGGAGILGSSPGGGRGGGGGSSSSSGGVLLAPDGPPRCVGVQLEDWKLVTGFSRGARGSSSSLLVYDIRACSSSSGGGSGSSSSGSSSRAPWQQPVLQLVAPGRVTCFQAHGQLVMAGQEGGEGVLWRFRSPRDTPASSTWQAWAAAAGGSGGVGSWGGGDEGVRGPVEGAGSPGADGGRGGRGGKKKGGAKVPAKKQTRYPKRCTR